jgi:4-hydroxy-tetrahydrodipicolinate reductase
MAGRNLGEILGFTDLDLRVSGSAEEALSTPCDVFVEYTKPDVAKQNVLLALQREAHVVVGTSGLTDQDYSEIDEAARSVERGVLAAGNFALTVVLLQKFAATAAKFIPHREIVDYAGSAKKDAPSGTARELAHRLSRVGESKLDVPLDETQGPRDARGVRLAGTQVHSLRLPGFVIAAEVIFGMPDQKLVLRHEAGSSAEPYVDGAMLAVRKVGELRGLVRGLDSIMDFE